MNHTNSGAWFPRCRLAWLERTARAQGTICRGDLCRTFGISTAQASADFQTYLALNPGSLRYDLSAKRYCWRPRAKLVILPAPWAGFPEI